MKGLMMKWLFFVLIAGFVLMPFNAQAASDWEHYKRGEELLQTGRLNEAIKELEKAASISAKASTLRKLAEVYEANGQYQQAAKTYYREAAVHKKLGAENTYLATKNKADALNSEIELFIEEMTTAKRTNLAKFEPTNGMYVGAYVEQDGVAKQQGNKFQNFNRATGKEHAIFFNYHRYGTPFPSGWVAQVKEAGGAVQLALEPNNGLAEVQDNQYLREFARDAKASGVPVFLRFASEMNGDWVKWHPNPQEYIQKFRLVSKVMKEEAPNVAMVWVPNSVPQHNIHTYYPGDQWVDWVGMNLYSVPYFNGNANQPADHVNPLDFLDTVYNTYASRKPMMIGEFAASHFTSVANKDVSKFGITKMHLFYEGMKMKYPRVKAVHWFSVDTLTAKYVSEARRFNNFCLTANSKFLAEYKKIVNDAYYLSDVVNGPSAEQEPEKSMNVMKLDGAVVRQSMNGIGFVKSYDPYISKVIYKLNGRYLSEATQYPFAFVLNADQLKSGKNQLEAIAYDSKGRTAVRKVSSFTKGVTIGSLKANQIKLFVNEPNAYTAGGTHKLLAAPYVQNKRTYVPLRFIIENFGATVEWEKKTEQITIKDEQRTLIFTVNSKKVINNGAQTSIDAPPMIKNGTTFVPLRVISELLGAKVEYHSNDKSLDIFK
ncbi:stalk domain-containing protein [Bacillus tianshenii]|nr:stalk domain-containing protein [Bacillus tianshenii]